MKTTTLLTARRTGWLLALSVLGARL